MFYKFPNNITLDECRSVINRHNERTGTKAFIEADKGEYIVFNYMISFEGAFPEPNTKDASLNREYAILRECRGIEFCKDTGLVITRKYHKFFNLLERAETQLDKINFRDPHHVLVKEDGSMLTAMLKKNGDLEWHTKMGATDVARPVNEFVVKERQYDAFARSMIAGKKTAIFEWCSRKQKIVIDYPTDNLILTAIRDNFTGEYMNYDDMKVLAHSNSIPVVYALDTSVDNIEEFLEHTRQLKGCEGYVIRFPQGMYKVKADEYCQLHRVKETLQHEKDVLSLILHDKIDDCKPMMSEPDRVRVDSFVHDFEISIANTAERLSWIVIAARDNIGDSKKRFALEIVNKDTVPAIERGLLFSIWDGHEPLSLVKTYLKENIGTSTKIDRVRHLFGNLNWLNYWNFVESDD